LRLATICYCLLLTHVADGCTCLLQHFVAAAAALILMGNAAWRCW